jgi:hypothetical protein
MSGMSSQQPIHICYYSNRCQWSRAFITEIGQTPWKSLFHYVCVDPSASRPPLPGWLKKVPTLVLSGDPEPKTDSDVMNWLYEKKMKEANSVKKGGAQGPAAIPGVGGEPDAWNIQEQSNFTKSFSYSGLDVDTSAQGNGGMSMPGAFSFLSGGAGVGDRTQSNMNASSDSGRRKSKKEEIFDKQLEMYQQERNSATPRGPARAI